MNFGQALDALKAGAYVTRKGWNGKGMFLWLKTGTVIEAEWCHDIKLREIAEKNGGTIEALPTICMKTADNKVLTGWVASQSDVLADDWQLHFEGFWQKKGDDGDWHVLEEEKVSAEDLKALDEDDRFEKALENLGKKVDNLAKKDTDAEGTINDIKKEFKMEPFYPLHVPTRTPEEEFQDKVDHFVFEIAGQSLDFVNSVKEQLKEEADTPEKLAILESRFKMFEDYVGNK